MTMTRRWLVALLLALAVEAFFYTRRLIAITGGAQSGVPGSENRR